MGGIVDLADVARHAGNAGLLGELLGLDLVAHGPDGAGVGADEDDAFVGAALGETGVFRQEAEARVDGLGAGLFAGVDDLVGDQVGFAGRGRTDEHRLVGHLHGQAVGVGLGVDDHRLYAHPPAGLDDPDGDFTPIGDQNFREHRPGHAPHARFCRAGLAREGHLGNGDGGEGLGAGRESCRDACAWVVMRDA